ncbi:MAG: hypothetical protein RMJ98_20080, partial [Myxococcales bacterium]|nr:hypothetical protein [Polyangiaceae bacterium]MDW8251600.1 hypothetical protein [Myxococcales bacterium]
RPACRRPLLALLFVQRQVVRCPVLLLAGTCIVALAAALSCGDVPVDTTNFPPQGTLEGSVIYTGPLPCTQRGHVLGAAILLVFHEDLLPAPDGLGTTATQFGVVPGDTLFAALGSQLPKNTSGDPDRVVCPPENFPPVTVSGRWAIGPLPAGRYQIRGFYDRDGDFSPIMKLNQLPTAGDIGGGAIANMSEVLQGKPARYQTLEVGIPGADGKLKIPENGANIRNITVTLGQPLPFARPIFHVAGVKDERPTTFTDKTGIEISGPPLTVNTDPTQVILPQDERFLVPPTSYPAQATRMFVRLTLGSGLPGAYPQPAGEAPSERTLGVSPPYLLQTIPPHDQFWIYPAVSPEGSLLTIPETPPNSPPGVPLIANLFPQAILAKLDPRDASDQTAQASPAVILQGLILHENLLATTVGTFHDPQTGAPRPPRPVQSLDVALRPSVICIPEPQNPAAPVYVVTPSFQALNGEPILNPTSIAEQVRAQLKNRLDVRVMEGCLPRGKYQMNLIYDTGQAWTIPNEGGVCTYGETPQGDECVRGVFRRRLLGSQAVSVQIGAPRDPAFCASTFPSPEYIAGVPSVCLRPDER